MSPLMSRCCFQSFSVCKQVVYIICRGMKISKRSQMYHERTMYKILYLTCLAKQDYFKGFFSSGCMNSETKEDI